MDLERLFFLLCEHGHSIIIWAIMISDWIFTSPVRMTRVPDSKLSTLGYPSDVLTCFPGGSAEKNLPANVGNAGDLGSIPRWGRSPGGKMATHFSILAWKIPWIEDLGCYSPQGCKELDTNEQLNMHTVVQILLVSLFDKWWNFMAVGVQSSDFVWFFATPWTIHSKEFSRPEYWSG